MRVKTEVVGGERMTELKEPQRVGPREAWRLVEAGRAPIFLDTRNAKHYAQSDEQIPGSLRIWREELEARIDEVPRDGRPIVTYCNCHYENSSIKAALILEEYDFTDLYILVGGIRAWRDEGLPLEPKGEEWGSKR